MSYEASLWSTIKIVAKRIAAMNCLNDNFVNKILHSLYLERMKNPFNNLQKVSSTICFDSNYSTILYLKFIFAIGLLKFQIDHYDSVYFFLKT